MIIGLAGIGLALLSKAIFDRKNKSLQEESSLLEQKKSGLARQRRSVESEINSINRVNSNPELTSLKAKEFSKIQKDLYSEIKILEDIRDGLLPEYNKKKRKEEEEESRRRRKKRRAAEAAAALAYSSSSSSSSYSGGSSWGGGGGGFSGGGASGGW